MDQFQFGSFFLINFLCFFIFLEATAQFNFLVRTSVFCPPLQISLVPLSSMPYGKPAIGYMQLKLTFEVFMHQYLINFVCDKDYMKWL